MNVKKPRLRTAALASLATAACYASLPAIAADAPNKTEELQEVVITGSLLRRTDTETASPVSVVTAETIEQRGQTSIQEAIQTLASNNGPALTNSFSANGAFGAGASAVSLRALSTNSTLVLFDGMRAAYYPLADDGSRNFVDLNTIPDAVIDRIETLRDGASSIYGADAIAGVVNVITKRQFKGLEGRVEFGGSERGDAGNRRASFITGKGDLAADGYNFYLSGFYSFSEALKNSQRGAPFNTDNLTGVCYEGHCGPNNIINSDLSKGLQVASNYLVRPYDATNTTAAGAYQMLNPALGCGNLTPYTLTAAERALAANAATPATVCQEDYTKLYGVIMPEVKRFGLTTRGTVRLSDTTEAYAQVNFLQSEVGYAGGPPTIRGNAPAGIIYPRYSTSATSGAYGNSVLTLPVYVCAARVNCATAADRRLNPNNPFAASNQVARLIGRLDSTRMYNQTRNRVYRFAAGLNGKVFNDWDYNLDVTGMHTDLLQTKSGYVYIQRLLDVIADGSYNFVNPSQNSQTVRDYLTPVNKNISTSDLYQAQFSVSKALMELPGGPLQVGLGATIFNESVDAPSANPDYNGPTQRYFTTNAFGTKGSRTVSAAFAETVIPFAPMFEGNLAGRYDRYSSGQSAFSPKAGLKFTPVKALALRTTLSRGFRIPSFAESNALPTTGYVTNSAANFPNAYLATYGCSQATFTTCPTYLRSSSYGATSLGTAGLKPEKSKSFTLGVVVQPIDNLSLTVDYYKIVKTNAITTASNTAAMQAYYLGQPIPAGFSVTPDAADINFPTLRPRIAFVQSGFVNANEIRSEGLDFSIEGGRKFGAVDWSSMAEASYIDDLSTTFPDGSVESYAGTLGNFNLTAGSGTPRWHGNWQNTFKFGKFSVTANAIYFGGYNLSAEDQGTVSGDCGMSSGYSPCNVREYVTVDLIGNMAVTDKISVYANLINVADKMPPIDHVTYGAHMYNAVQGGTGIIGRAFRLGVKAKL